jgi:hypothetical protein
VNEAAVIQARATRRRWGVGRRLWDGSWRGDGAVLSGTDVLSIVDSVGGVSMATTTSAKPQTTTINGQPALQFSASGELMQALVPSVRTRSGSIALVATRPSAAGVFASAGRTDFPTSQFHAWNSGTSGLSCGGICEGKGALTRTFAVAAGQPFAAFLTWDTSLPWSEMRLSGVATPSRQTLAFSIVASIDRWRLGGSIAGGSLIGATKMGEFSYGSKRATPAEIDAWFAYCLSYWGI